MKKEISKFIKECRLIPHYQGSEKIMWIEGNLHLALTVRASIHHLYKNIPFEIKISYHGK